MRMTMRMGMRMRMKSCLIADPSMNFRNRVRNLLETRWNAMGLHKQALKAACDCLDSSDRLRGISQFKYPVS